MGKKQIGKIASVLLISFVILGIGIYAYVPSIPKLFRLNKECQEQGYYMAEFEFKMLGLAYLLDNSHYWQAITTMRNLHNQLTTKNGLVKLPAFTNKKQELEFYLNLQNPKTGAFMDDTYPLCTYHSPTENVLLHLEALTNELGEPLQLKYPLKYLDEINTPDKLKAYLDDVSNIGWIGAKFPETSFHFARDIFNAYNENVIERNNLYTFSPTWKHALMQWFYENQDPETGFWGPRSKSNGKLLKRDISNTSSITKTFVDKDGNTLHTSFPLRYKKEMFKTTLQIMSEPTPAENALDEWHGWALKMTKGFALLTRYVWESVSHTDHAEAEKLAQMYMKMKFENYYIPHEGAFSYYPKSNHATLDGTGDALGYFSNVGIFSTEQQKRLWGDPEKTCTNLGHFNGLTETNQDTLKSFENINAYRIYAGEPTPAEYTTHAVGVFYPRDTTVLDIIELVPKIKNWVQTTPQSMGNWVSRAEILDRLSNTHIKPVPISKENIPLEQLNGILDKNKTVTLIGFDILQIPRYRIAYTRQTKT